MRVLVAGATGVIGQRMVPVLAAAGHEVVGMVRTRADAGRLAAAGATAVVADALDRGQVEQAVRRARPEAIVTMLTAIPAQINPRRLARDFALTNRLRTEGTRHLLEAGATVGVQRFISQGLAYAYQPAEKLADEDAPLWTRGTPRQFAPVLSALRELERLTATAPGGLVLRLGHLYGPGTVYAPDGSFTRQVRAGKVPLVGGGDAVFSFTHADDVASAVVAALDRPDVTGVLNVVDDSPEPLHEWLPAFAAMLRAPAPKPVPAWLAQLAVGGWGVAFLNRLRGADNARARLRLDWRPRYASWADGFAAELGVERR